MSRIDEIREKLRGYVYPKEGENLREELKRIADKTYMQKYSDTQHMEFLDRNGYASIDIIHPQSTNFPYYLGLFTVITQHIYADNLRQVLDKAIDIEIEKENYL